MNAKVSMDPFPEDDAVLPATMVIAQTDFIQYWIDPLDRRSSTFELGAYRLPKEDKEK